MKKFKRLSVALAVVALSMGAGTIAGCSSAAPQQPARTAAHAYYCPMHPEVVQDGPGKCPKCGMDLVEKN